MAETSVPLYAILKRRESEITQLAEGGDQLAKRVINLYQLHYTCPGDQVALTLLQCVYQDFALAHPEPDTTAPIDA